MLNLILLLQLSASSTIRKAAEIPPTALGVTAVIGNVPLADRARGATISDPSGSPLGIVDTSGTTMVTLLVGTYKIQVPANTLGKLAGRLTLPVTSQQIETLMAASAKFQAQFHPSPKAVQPPKGFSRVASAASAASIPPKPTTNP